MVRFPFDLDRGWILRERTDRFEDHFAIGEELGRGQFGVVKLCTRCSTGVQYACKLIDKKKLSHWEDKEDVRREVEIMQRLRGDPFTLELEEVFEDENHVHLVMELCKGGDLFDEIDSRGRLTEAEAASAFKEIVLAVVHCHDNGVLHRDLKPENILLVRRHGVRSHQAVVDTSGEHLDTGSRHEAEGNSGLQTAKVKLTDFGLSLIVEGQKKVCGVAGSPYYLAPEVLAGSYGLQADVWSLGVMLYMLLSGSAPFFGETEDDVLNAVRKGKFSFQKSIWSTISPLAKDLIRTLLQHDPTERPAAIKILQHPWFTEVFHKQLGSDSPDARVQGSLQERRFKNSSDKENVSLSPDFVHKAAPDASAQQLPCSPVSHLQSCQEFSPFTSRSSTCTSPPSPPRLELENLSINSHTTPHPFGVMTRPASADAGHRSALEDLEPLIMHTQPRSEHQESGVSPLWAFFGGQPEASTNQSTGTWDDTADTTILSPKGDMRMNMLLMGVSSMWSCGAQVDVDWVFGF